MPVAESDETMEWLLKWWPLLASAVSVVVGWGYWSLRRHLVPREEFASELNLLRAADASLEERVMRVEVEIEHLPTREDMSGLSDRVATLTGDVRMVAARLDGVHEMLERMDRQFGLLLEHHIKDGNDG